MVVDIQSIFKEVHNQGIELTSRYNFFQNVLMKYWDMNHDDSNEELLSKKNAKNLLVKMYEYYNEREAFYDSMNEKEKRDLFTEFVDKQLELLK